jgi:hypothetical protein
MLNDGVDCAFGLVIGGGRFHISHNTHMPAGRHFRSVLLLLWTNSDLVRSSPESETNTLIPDLYPLHSMLTRLTICVITHSRCLVYRAPRTKIKSVRQSLASINVYLEGRRLCL